VPFQFGVTHLLLGRFAILVEFKTIILPLPLEFFEIITIVCKQSVVFILAKHQHQILFPLGLNCTSGKGLSSVPVGTTASMLPTSRAVQIFWNSPVVPLLKSFVLKRPRKGSATFH
jgi:hypothetical protein